MSHPEVEQLEARQEQAGPTPEAEVKGSQATQLVHLAAKAELFHTPSMEGYGTVLTGDHCETWPLKSKPFKHWLRGRFFKEARLAPSAQALQDAIGVLESKALFEGPKYPVHVRLAEHEGTIHLDLTNEHWEAVRITAQGWEVTAAPPVKFRRSAGMVPLPTPTKDGKVDSLRRFVNLAPDHPSDWISLVAWMLAALRPRGPYPVLVLHGEQGSGKSSLVKMLRCLLDPNTSPLRAEPREVRDLMITASNSWCLTYDNLSRIEPWLSDALCRLATGGGFSTRELYADTDEVLFDAQRPVILNGIEELATRADLLDRAILLYLPMIKEENRRDESELWQHFETERPGILGALLTAVSSALKNFDTVKLDRLPRMADFAKWATAAGEGLGWRPGDFSKAYQTNRDNANELALEGSIVVPPLRTLMALRTQWSGIATELLRDLKTHIDESVKTQRSWPKNGKGLSDRLRRIAPNLRAIGIRVTWSYSTDRTHSRLILLEQLGAPASTASEPSETPSGHSGQSDASDSSDARTPLYSSELMEVNLDVD